MRFVAIVSVLVLATFPSCALIVQGEAEEISIDADVQDVRVTIDGVGTKMTPCTFELERDGEYVVVIEKRGYKTVEIVVEGSISAIFFGNILFGGVIGIVVDVVTGAAYDLEPDEIFIRMEPGNGRIRLSGDDVQAVDGHRSAP